MSALTQGSCCAASSTLGSLTSTPRSPATLFVNASMALGASGSLTWQLTPEGQGTRVELVYAVGGYKPGGLQAMAPVVDKVLAEQLQRLKAYVEKS